MCKKLIIVTNCDPERTSDAEQRLKEIYLRTDPKPGITFVHKGTQPYQIAEKSKEKKPVAIIFDDTVPHPTITAIIDSVSRKIPHKKPRFIHVSLQHSVATAENAESHTKAHKLIAA